MNVYNVEAALVDLFFTKGDTINLAFNDITLNGVAYDMTGFRLDMHVRRRDGLLVRSFSTAGASPTMTIIGDSFTLYSTTAFDVVGDYVYDVQVFDGTDTLTIMKGSLNVEKEQTI